MNERTLIYVILIATMPIVTIIAFFIIRKMNLFNIDAVKLNEIGMIPQYLCPKCGVDIQKGFSRTDGIAWRKESDPPLPSHIRRNQALNNTVIVVNGRENIAWHCQQCKLILIDHSIVAKVT